MTRVLVLSDLWMPFPGGAERLMFNIARDLARRGNEVLVLTAYEAAERFDGPPVKYDDGVTLMDRVRALAPGVVLVHHHWAFKFEADLVGLGVPVVQVVLNGHRIPQVALAVYISEWVRGQLGDAQPQDMTITPPAMPDVIADRHGDRIGFVKPIPHKGVDLVYRIARAMPDRRFLILRGEWQTLEDIRRAPNVEFMGPVRCMADFYARCRLMLMPSISEDAGTVAQEAAVNGLPCISTAVGGLAETNAAGVLLPADPAQWAATIVALDDSDTYQRVAARQLEALNEYDHPGRLARLAAAIDGLGAGR